MSMEQVTMRCLTCDESSLFYNKVDKSKSNCYTGVQEKYYLSNNVYEKCYLSCLTCNGEGTFDSNNCATCDNANDYYKVDDSNYAYECWDNYTKKDNYVFIDSIQSYRACYIGCASCLEIGDATTPKCTTCNNKDGYYALIDEQSNCINTKKHNYYLDNYTKLYQPCYSFCDECTDGFTSTNHNCINCNADTIKHPLNPSNCVTKCAEGTYWYIDDNGTYKCTSGLHCSEERPILERNNNQCIEN